MNKNFLNKSSYLISKELHSALESEKLTKEKSLMSKKPGIYIVAVRLLNKEDRTLIYNYIYYDSLFLETFLQYLFYKNLHSTRFSEWGDTLFVIEENIVKLKYRDFKLSDENNFRYLITNREDLVSALGNLDNFYIYSTINRIINIINKLNFVSKDMNELTEIVDLSVKKDIKKYIHLIMDPLYNSEFKKSMNIDDLKYNSNEINLLNSTLYVVNNLSDFKQNITNRGYVINEGVQKWRGQINSMSGILSSMDMDFRNSLYYHNEYHVKQGQVDSHYFLPKNKFSFRNIHMNLGNVRWYSTKRTINKITKTDKLLERIKSNTFQTDSIIYMYLSRFLKNSPINEITERELESFLLEYSYRKMSEKDKSGFNYQIFQDKKIQNIIIDSINVLNNYIQNFKNRVFNINTKKPSQLTISRYHLNLILKNIDQSVIIDLSLGIISRIIGSHNKLNEDTINVNIFNDIGNVITAKYFYSLYKDYVNTNIVSFCEYCTKYLDSITIEDEVKQDIIKLIKKINSNLDKDVNYLYSLVKEILSYDIMSNIDYNNNEQINGYTLSDWKLDNKEIVSIYQDNATLKNGLGAIIVEWWIESNLVQQKLITIGKNDRRNFIIPSDNIIAILEKNNDHSVKHLPLRIPMIVKPKPYYKEVINGKVKERLGGYLLNDEKVTDPMIIPNWQLRETSTVQDLNVVYNLVNNMNSVGFKINKDMLDFIETYADEFNLLLNQVDFSNMKSKLTKSELNELESHVSKLNLQENILGLAKVYSDMNEFYLPVRIDYRGRMNCVSQYLNYQSTELAKSLLLFSKGEKLMKNDDVAIGYFKAYGANCFGNKLDKKSWEDRSKWIDNNEYDILNFRNGKLIQQADNKLLFISFCIEFSKWKKAYDNIEISHFTTYLPIQLDASCNGYQHLSLLISDHEMAKELNLTKSTRNDIPKDYYSYITIKLSELFFTKSKSEKISSNDRDCYIRLNKMLITRSILKKAIMTIPYNVSTMQMIKYLKQHFIKVGNKTEDWSCYTLEYQYKDNPNVMLCSKDISLIALGLREVLELNFPKLKFLIMYLKAIASICNKLNLVIPWGSSSGLLVNQSYTKPEEVKLKPFSYSSSSLILKVSTKKLDNNKQIRAFMPNLVHSLDAASLALLAEYYFNEVEIKNFYAIHDCFAVTANNVEKLVGFLKSVYIKIYSEDGYLRKFDNEIIQHIKFHYGEGCFNHNTLELIANDHKLKYPDINFVLGNRLPSPDLILNSSYLIS